MKPVFMAITTITIKKWARSMNNKLIREDFVASFVLIELEDAVFSWNGTRGLDISRTKFQR